MAGVGAAMTKSTLRPRDAKEVEEAVRWALGNEKPLEVAGQGTKRTIGRPSQADLTLELSGLTGVTLYEPAELVLSARAGTPIHPTVLVYTTRSTPADFAAARRFLVPSTFDRNISSGSRVHSL